jgi:hypothetical protein
MKNEINVNKLIHIKEKIIISIIAFFYCLFEYIYLTKIYNNNISCKSLDPFTVEKKILNSKQILLCKSELTEHICFKNNYSFFEYKNGVICMMKNFFLNFSNWKQDGYIYDYNGPVNMKTKGQALISYGFFKMHCNIKGNISNFNPIYNKYFNSWEYILNNQSKNEIYNQTELCPGKVLFILNRNQDSPNLLIGGAGFINAFSLMYLLRIKPENIQVLFLESMIINKDPFYNLFKNIISRGGEPLYARNLDNNIIYHVSKAINVPINWDSPVFCKTETPNCLKISKSYKILLESIYKYMKIPEFFDKTNYDKEIFLYPKSFNISKLNEYKKYMTILWRKPWPKNRKNQERILGNGEEILEKLDSVLFKEKFLIRLVDTAILSFEEQISIMQKTNYLLGIHGAGMFLSIFLPYKSIAHEIKKKKRYTTNRPQIAGILSGHKYYSDFVEADIKNLDFQEKYFVDLNDLEKKVLKILNENNFLDN